jgi:hypothetical protein
MLQKGGTLIVDARGRKFPEKYVPIGEGSTLAVGPCAFTLAILQFYPDSFTFTVGGLAPKKFISGDFCLGLGADLDLRTGLVILGGPTRAVLGAL